MKLLTIAFTMMSVCVLHAQEAIVTTGGNSTSNGGSFSYSLGQVFYTSQTGADGSVTQGVQQTYEITTTVGVQLAEISLKLMAYPNPTSSNLTLKIDAYSNEKLTYHLINTEGKLINSQNIEAEQTLFDMQLLPSGTYQLQVYDAGTLIKNFRIIKH